VVAVQLDAEADHRLAGALDAVDDLLRPAVLDADHDHGRHVGVAAGADQRAEVQVQVGAELQPAVGVRDRHRALDVVRHGLGGRVGQVVQRQDDDVVADADAAVLAPVAEEGGVLVDDDAHGGSFGLPALGLDVVDVGMLAGLDRRHDLAHVDAVLDDGVADGHVLAQRHLVADRDVLLGLTWIIGPRP
jgi:hypothetical protein